MTRKSESQFDPELFRSRLGQLSLLNYVVDHLRQLAKVVTCSHRGTDRASSCSQLLVIHQLVDRAQQLDARAVVQVESPTKTKIFDSLSIVQLVRERRQHNDRLAAATPVILSLLSRKKNVKRARGLMVCSISLTPQQLRIWRARNIAYNTIIHRLCMYNKLSFLRMYWLKFILKF